MKWSAVLALVLMVTEMAIRPAWAVDAPQAYHGGLLTLLFLGVCALIVVAQLVPALILMMGTISGLAKRMTARRQIAAAGVNRDETE
jgi:hypothetical protein